MSQTVRFFRSIAPVFIYSRWNRWNFAKISMGDGIMQKLHITFRYGSHPKKNISPIFSILHSQMTAHSCYLCQTLECLSNRINWNFHCKLRNACAIYVSMRLCHLKWAFVWRCIDTGNSKCSPWVFKATSLQTTSNEHSLCWFQLNEMCTVVNAAAMPIHTFFTSLHRRECRINIMVLVIQFNSIAWLVFSTSFLLAPIALSAFSSHTFYWILYYCLSVWEMPIPPTSNIVFVIMCAHTDTWTIYCK